MSSCACVYADYESCEDISTTRPRARVEHKCTECRRTIEPGEVYESSFSRFDGQTETYKTCADCLSIRDEFFCSGWGFTMLWTDLTEHIREVITYGDSIASDCLESLTPHAREAVCDIIEERWKDLEDDGTE